MSVLKTVDLRKCLGKIEARGGLSLRVEEGKIYGLVGQNGAGQATLIRTLRDIISEWQARPNLLGQAAGSANVRARVGYLPEDHRCPDYPSWYSLADFYGQMLSVTGQISEERSHEMLDFVGVGDRIHYAIHSFSRGMKQRLGIAQALLHESDGSSCLSVSRVCGSHTGIHDAFPGEW